MNPTDQQLQLALAKELPELISIIEPTDSGCHFETYFHWRDTDLALVTPREWDWIVRECEKKLTNLNAIPLTGKRDVAIAAKYCFHEWLIFITHEKQETLRFQKGTPTYPEGYPVGINNFLCVTASWQQRAIAYFKTTGKQI